MKQPYIIEKMIIITYSGNKIPLEIKENIIMDKPKRLLKESILDQFSSLDDKPVKVILKTRTV